MATASPSVNVKKQLDDTVECSICTEVYSDPRSLPCVHTFCFKCLTDWCKDKKPGDQVACPLCRQEAVIPSGGIAELPRNFFIGKLLKINELASPKSETVRLCDLCSIDDEQIQESDKIRRTAVVFCVQCQQNLCAVCGQMHGKLNISRYHTTVNLNESPRGEAVYVNYPSTICDKHPNKSIEIYCLDCKTTLCTICYIKEHNSHKNAEVAEVEGEFRIGLAQGIEKMTASIARCDDTLKALQLKKTSFFDQVKKVESEICDRADRLKASIDEGKQKLIAELYEMKTSREKQMDNLAAEITQSMSFLESLRKYASELLKKGTASDVARQADSLRRRTDTLGKTAIIENTWHGLSIVDITFSPSSIDLIDAVGIGQVINKGSNPENLVLARTQSGKQNVLSIASQDSQIFVTREGVAQVSIYNSNSFELKLQMTFPGLGETLYGLATCASMKYLYISDNSRSCIHRVDFSITEANHMMKWKVDNPRALSVNSTHNVLVAIATKKIQEYTSTGKLVREISDSNDLWHAVELRSGIIAVSRCGPIHGIAMISMDGQVIRSYGGQPGSWFGQMNAPRCLAIDNHGYILVADSENRRLLVLNQSMTKDCELPLPGNTGLNHPFALNLDQTKGQLYVGERGSDKRNAPKVNQFGMVLATNVVEDEPRRLLVFKNITASLIWELFSKMS